MKKLLLTVCIVLSACAGYCQSGNSNIGTEFWTAWMDHIDPATGNTPSQMNLYIACDVATTGTVALADGSFSAPFTVQPNIVTTFAIPASAFLGNTNGTLNKGIHITSVNPIAVYAHIYASSVSGATLLLPVNTMANDYYSLNYLQLSNATPSYSAFMIIATQNNTTVQVTPSAALIDGSPANTTFTITLNQGQVYQGLSGTDLTGTHIVSVSTNSQSCKKIAVFSGSNKIYIGKPNMTSDNLFQQVYPTASWGKTYITVPLKNRNYDVYRIVLSTPNTNVTLNGAAVPLTSFTNNLYYEFNSQQTNVITADQPIQVVQYAVTEGNTITGKAVAGDVGDPEMIYLNPLEQTIDHTILFSTSKYLILSGYINVVVPTAAASSFLLDGVSQANAFTTVPNNTAYSYAQLNVAVNATHVISASQGFNAIAYGFGQDESYGYAAGTNVKNLNEYVQYNNPVTNQAATSGCTGTALEPQVILPYQTTSITWDFGNGTTPVVQTNPTYKSTLVKNGVTLYLYDYGTPISYTAGSYAVAVTVVDPVTTVCGSNEEVDLNFTVANPPTASFAARDSICVTDTIGFKDLSLGNGSAIQSWKWNFGNSDTSIVQNPVYKYLTPGDYTVSLTVTIATGCPSVFTKKVHVRPLPVAAFAYSTPDCDTQAVTFTDQSTTAEGKIATWNWDFGDGSTPSTLQNPTHVFNPYKTYIVTLSVTNSGGCSGPSVSQQLIVNPLPVASFVLPDVCLADAAATFTAVPDKNGLVYSWNFGDLATNISATNPNTATGLTVQHKYNTAGAYSTTLTVTTNNGCVADTIKSFYVYGSSPVASFTVPNSGDLCSNQPVTFVDNAMVPGFGDNNVTSVDMYYDFGNNPTVFVHYERPAIGQILTHTYPLETTTSHQYKVMMIAYSGQKCFDTYTLPVTVLPVPTVTFAALPNVCQNAGLINLASYTTAQGPAGTARFYQDGNYLASGMFDPSTAALGQHVITFIYAANSTGCADTLKQNITVAPIPTVSAGADQEVILGESVVLNATATGSNLTYLWTPAAGLNDPTLLNPKATPSVDTRYTLTVTSTTGGIACPVSDSTHVKILHLPVVPNTFTPNGDNINDTWLIQYLDQYSQCTVKVFTRNGELIFSSIGYGTPWDGTYKGSPLPVGAYYYIIDPKHNLPVLTGAVNLIR